MKYFILLFLFFFFVIGILNYIEIRKIKKINREKEVTLTLIDHYMKLYWDTLPKLMNSTEKKKDCNKQVLEQIKLERNHVYERMNMVERLINHAKMEKLLEELDFKEESDSYLQLKEIENQIGNVSKEYERLNQLIERKKENPLLKVILFVIKL